MFENANSATRIVFVVFLRQNDVHEAALSLLVTTISEKT